MTAVTDEDQGNGTTETGEPEEKEDARSKDGRWDDGLIARRAAAADPRGGDSGTGHSRTDGGSTDSVGPSDLTDPSAPADSPPDEDDVRPQVEAYGPSGGPLPTRLDALRELVGLSRARLDRDTLAEAGRVLDEAAARQRLSSRHTVVAIAGATGSGKSTLFNALAGTQISDTGLRRPTTSQPIACSWTDGAAGLLDRLAIPGRLRRRPHPGPAAFDEALQGLVLVDLPDHDSAATAHRDQVDRVLALVDAVIWVVDPEKYADAALHERYLRPLAGHAEVTFVVLNQIDRLPGEAADLVLDDLRRLLDEDGMALGEHGEPGATVMSLSALTGDGVPELREMVGRFVQDRTAATRRSPPTWTRRRRGCVRCTWRRGGRDWGSGPGRSSPTGWPRPSGRPPPGRPPSGSGAGTPGGRAGRRGCGCGAGTSPGGCPAAWTGWARRSPRPRRSRPPGSGWSRRSGPSRTAPPPGSPPLGAGGARGGVQRGEGAAGGAGRAGGEGGRGGRFRQGIGRLRAVRYGVGPGSGHGRGARRPAGQAAPAEVVARRGPCPGLHDAAPGLRRPVAARPDRRGPGAGARRPRADHAGRGRRRAAR
ncbi:GTPase HflX [Streptomyces sp. KY70]|nr:GTPase HflX [Streptomyces sp. KY70]